MSVANILVADDSRSIRTLVRQVLTDAGYTVEAVADGQQAVDAAKMHCPDLVVLDIQMPHKDGYATCQELLALGDPWCNVPFVFLSRMRVGALQLLGDELGAYLPKPVQAESLLQTVDNLLGTAPVDAAATVSKSLPRVLSHD